jgi:hypothetical protein
MAFVTFGGLIFEFLTPFILGCHNFFTFILFLMIFRAQEAPIGGVQVLFIHKKQWIAPLRSSMP